MPIYYLYKVNSIKGFREIHTKDTNLKRIILKYIYGCFQYKHHYFSDKSTAAAMYCCLTSMYQK
jgi:hypothetical protein